MTKEYKLIVFDADGTLRRCTVEGQPCPNANNQWELIPGVKEKLAYTRWGTPHGGSTAVGIASNQAGVAHGFMTRSTAFKLLKDLFLEAFGIWPYTGAIQMCYHAEEDNCPCRKPKPLMLQRIASSWKLDMSKVLFVGDMESDRQAAKNAGCDFMWAKDFFDGGSL